MKSKFNWEEFTNKSNHVIVRCETESDAVNFCKLMDSHNVKWLYGDKYTDYNYWDVDVL